MDRPDLDYDGKHSWYQYAVHLEGKLAVLEGCMQEALDTLEGVQIIFENHSPRQIVNLKELRAKQLGEVIMEINRRKHENS